MAIEEAVEYISIDYIVKRLGCEKQIDEDKQKYEARLRKTFIYQLNDNDTAKIKKMAEFIKLTDG